MTDTPRTIPALILFLMLTGCYETFTPMTNEQVVAAVHYCTSNGMDADQWRRFGLDGATLRVNCVIRKGDK